MKGRAKQQAKPERKKAIKAAPQRIGSDEAQQETFLRHLRAFVHATGTVEDAQSGLREVCERAKKEHVTKRSLKFAMALNADDGVEKAKAERDEQMRVATWLGHGPQLEMFAEEAPDPIWEEGKRAAMTNERAVPPPHHSQKAAQRWMHGWHHGMKIVNANRDAAVSQFEPLGKTVADITEKAGVAGSAPAPATNVVTGEPSRGIDFERQTDGKMRAAPEAAEETHAAH
jgi:hypothetical protein